MARRWQTIRVELVSGRGDVLDPPPGRMLIIPPRTTFETLADAIDLAFARWDHAHLQVFTLADGTEVSDEETLSETAYAYSAAEPIGRTLSIQTALGRRLKTGDRFTYVFDLGDDWTHVCTVEGTADPFEVLGVHVADPTPYWGWGTIPDQYGRRWDGDSGDPSEPPPARGSLSLVTPAPTRFDTPQVERLSGKDLRVARHTPHDLVDALVGVNLDEVLQQAGAALLDAVADGPSAAARGKLMARMFEVLQRLEAREWDGDDVLVEALLATLQGRSVSDKEATAVDVTELADHLHGEFVQEGVDVNIVTGFVIPHGLELEALDEDDEYGDAYGDKENTIHLYPDHRDWDDLAAFAGAVEDKAVVEELLDAIEGKGAFSRFRRVIDKHDLVDRWLTFRDDRRIGHARTALDLRGFRPRN